MAQVMSKAKSATAAKEKQAAQPEAPAEKSKRNAKGATSSRKAASDKNAKTAKASAKRATPDARAARSKHTRSDEGSVAGTRKELSKTHARLLRKMQDERAKLVHQAAELEAEQRALAADPEAAEMSSDLESGDCVASREREVDLRVSAHVGEMIEQIDRATERLHAGTYGACSRCGAKIPAARLEALPYAELCVSCQQQHERLYH